MIRMRAVHDNQGNAFAMLREYSRKLPMAAVHMELVAACEELGVFPEISHVPREENTWADELSNSLTEDWDPDKRWVPVVAAGATYDLHEGVESGCICNLLNTVLKLSEAR